MKSTTYVSIEKDFFVIFLLREKLLFGAMKDNCTSFYANNNSPYQ